MDKRRIHEAITHYGQEKEQPNKKIKERGEIWVVKIKKRRLKDLKIKISI